MTEELNHRLVCMITQADREAIQDAFYDMRFKTQSEAVRAILAAGLAAMNGAPAAKPQTIAQAIEADIPPPAPPPFVPPVLVILPNQEGHFHKLFHRKLTAMMEQHGKSEFTESEILMGVFGRAQFEVRTGDLAGIANNMPLLGFQPRIVRASRGQKATKTYAYNAP